MARFPYPGLRPFERDEADLFFGREKQVDAMVDRLAERRLLMVTGSSGSGKSSLVRAGLLEALEMGLLAEAGPLWRFAIMRPRDHPMAELAAALLGASDGIPSSESVALRRAALDRGPLSLVEQLRDEPLAEGANLLILVDQFEELFRYREMAEREEAEAFVALLLATAAQREVPVYVVLTMRSDFFGECAQFEGLSEAICAALYLCPRLTRDQIIAAIEGPAQVFHGRVEPALTARLANDMGTNPDQLPLMQHALMRLWDQARAREPATAPLLTFEDYLAADGLRGSLSRHADEILDQVTRDTADCRDVARRLFCLVTEGEGERAVRRLAPVAEVVAVAERPLEDVARIADAFREPSSSLLMPPITESLTPATVLDISHEALIRNWQTLKEWVREESVSASRYRETERRFHQRLIGEAPPWDAHELSAVLAWIEQERPNSTWAARYGGNFDQLLTSAKSAAVHQAKALWAGRLSLVVNTIGAIVDVTFFHAAPAVWLAMIGMIYGTVQRNLSRNFLAARSWAIMWAGVLVVLLIYSTYQQLQDHTMTMALGITMTTFTVVLLFLIYIYVQLRPLTLRRRAQSAAEPEFDPRRRRQARFALVATLVVLVITSIGQAIYGIVNQVYIPADNSGTSLADAAASLVLAGVFYATTNRNLPRNLAFVRGAIGVWAFLDLFALLNNITIGARALAAVDCAIALCLAFALISLMPGLRAVIGLRAGRNAFAARQARGLQ